MINASLQNSSELLSDNVVFVSENRAECISRTIDILKGNGSAPLHRPNVNIKLATISFSIFTACIIVLFFLLDWLFPTNLALILSFSAALLCFVIFFKKILIFFVQLYQRYAAESTRRRCCFVPTCSEYMLLSVSKYGAFRGFLKGVFRLCRCHYPNGGVDEP